MIITIGLIYVCLILLIYLNEFLNYVEYIFYNNINKYKFIIQIQYAYYKFFNNF
jgi:hypothetical protein